MRRLLHAAALGLCALSGAARADAFVAIPVPATTIAAGATITPESLGERRYRVTYVEKNPFVRAPQQAVGLAARRTLAKGRPIALGDLTQPLAVRAGDVVDAEFRSGALVLGLKMKALDEGAKGATIRLANLQTGVIVPAIVSGAGQARITP
jgi:flagella basal body P-ring formation protein FlgA